MSKSDPNPNSRILITDTTHEIWEKTMGAVTDSMPNISYDPENRPGVSNLLDILSVFDPNGRTPEEWAVRLAGESLKDLKATVASLVAKELEGISERYTELISNKITYLHCVEEEGAFRARSRAAETMTVVRSAIGL